MKYTRKNMKIKSRIVSAITAVLMMANSFPLSVFQGMIKFQPPAEISAAADYAPITSFPTGTEMIVFNDIDKLIAYSYYYQTDSGFADSHKSNILNIALQSGNENANVLSTDFRGIGTKSSPFQGTLMFSTTTAFELQTYRALFCYLADTAVIKGTNAGAFTLKLKRLSDVASDVSAPVLAEHVEHVGSGGAEWSVELTGSHTTSGAIGTIADDAVVTLRYKNSANTAVISNAPYLSEGDMLADVGVICGSLGNRAELTLEYDGVINGSVTSAHGNAGGLIGTMGSDSKLIVKTAPTVYAPQVTANGSEADQKGYAGCLVGKLDSTASLLDQAGNALNLPVTTDGSATGATGAGGLFGYYQYVIAEGVTGTTLDLDSYSTAATVYGKYCGGLFGVLEATGDLKITNTASAAKSYASGSGTSYDNKGYFGGVAGRFLTSSLGNTLELSSLEVSPTSADAFAAFGGVIGIVDSAAYVKVNDVTITAAGTNQRTTDKAYFGGLIGATSAQNGVFVDLGNYTLTTNEDFRGGGVVGQFNNGVLRLSGKTDLSGAKPYGTYAAIEGNAKIESNYGQLVGNNDNVLVYALGSGEDADPAAFEDVVENGETTKSVGWRYLRSNGAIADDLGTWGQVVRQFNGQNAEDAGIVTFSSSDHTVTLAAMTATNGKYAIGTTTDFAKAALNIMLNTRADGFDCLKFTSGSAGRAALLAGSIGMTANINLSRTGLNGFMRDGATGITVSDTGSVGEFTGTFSAAMGDNLAAMPVVQFAALTPAQLAGLTVSQIATLTAAQLAALTPAQLTALTAEQITALTEAQKAGLSAEQLTALTAPRTTPEQKEKVFQITFAVGEPYGITAASEGVGQIYRHQYNGLFSVIGSGTTAGTVKDLKIGGTFAIHNAGKNGMSIGGIAARSHGSTTLENIIASQTVNYFEGGTRTAATADWGKYLGGLIGYTDLNTDNGTIQIKGTTKLGTIFNFERHPNNWIMCGGAIGAVESSKIHVKFAESATDSCTVSATVNNATHATDKGTADEFSCIGGLIGYVDDAGVYSNRTIDIDHTHLGVAQVTENNVVTVTAAPLTITNAATASAGGLLGYSWYNATVNVKGLTVANAALNYSAADIGAMCYDATGVWNVDSLTVSKLTMTDSAAGTLGMLVNKAYTDAVDDDGVHSYTGGLYLNVLSSGYILTNTNDSITLPDSLTKYDELAAYSAKDEADVLKGGAGIISVNMNTTRAGTVVGEGNSAATVKRVKVTETGTYQNQLSGQSSHYANSTARYYYNLDNMSSANDGQNLVLWSAHKYAHSSIDGALPATTLTTTLTGTADLTGLSFYPLAEADSYTISGLNVTFDYDGIATTAEGVFSTTHPTDSYVRNPGATGVARNQHYLMHSGLFIDLPAGKTLTISGTGLTLNGNFLEVGDYQGVLISGTMRGSIDGSSGSILLNGIKPKTISGTSTAVYTDGYLLINRIRRADATAPIPSLKLKGVSTGSGYTTDGATAKVAKSLIGTAEGPGLNMEFSEIKLDARSSNSVTGASAAQLAAMDTAYNTKNSIFQNSTLLASIKTDQNAQLIYNYTRADDWDTSRNVTYGYEVSGSVQYAGQENKYSKAEGETDRYFTNPLEKPTVSANTSGQTEFNFTSNFIRYVYTPYTASSPTELYFQELKVNVMAEGLIRGCGTYNDPYLITSPNQLKAVAEFLKNNDKASTLGDVTLPIKKPASFESGNRWCAGGDAHATYLASESVFTAPSGVTGADEWSNDDVQRYLASAYYKIENNITLDSNFVGLGGDTANTAFRGVIVGKVTNGVSPTITNESNNPFINVSNGCVLKDVNVSVGANIERRQDKIFEEVNKVTYYYTFGYGETDTSRRQCNYYGGIIGEIMGGDNIIDNCYVDFNSYSVRLYGDKGLSIPVGGYVGVVVYGGLIFKNMTASHTNLSRTHLNVYYDDSNASTDYTSNNLAANTEKAKAAIYVNPIVGRVINGYAVNETKNIYSEPEEGEGPELLSAGRYTISEDGKYHDDEKSERFSTANGANSDLIHLLQNGTKHYTIADINRDEEKMLDVTSVATASAKGNINVPNGQALFILSLITQSTAGTATNAALGAYTNSLAYGTYNGTVFGMSRNGEYSDVGTDTEIRADDPETPDVDESSDVPDFSTLAKLDTANNTDSDAPIPYLVKHYTVGGTIFEPVTTTETRTREVTRTVTEDVTHYDKTKFTGTTLPTGTKFVIKATRPGKNNEYLTNRKKTNDYNRNCVLLSTYDFSSTDILTADENKLKNAAEFYFEPNDSGTAYCIYYLDDNNQRQYLAISKVVSPQPNNTDRGNLEINTNACYFTIGNDGDRWYFKWTDSNKDRYITYDGGETYFSGYKTLDDGSKFELYTVQERTEQVSHTVTYEEEYEVEITNYDPTHNYPARCVTSTLGYYDINLNAKTANGGTEETPLDDYTYQLPDSFRGLGCVGIYDSYNSITNAANTNIRENQYSIKLDEFDGNDCTIDEDIYLNKQKTDNYFNVLHDGKNSGASVTQSTYSDVKLYRGNRANSELGVIYNHGIGLFDSVVTKSPASSIKNFVLTGSVNTEIYSNDYLETEQEQNYVEATNDDRAVLWLSSGGVCGWMTNGIAGTFLNISLNDLTVSGADFVGGLLGFSGLCDELAAKGFTIQQCSADNIIVEMTSARNIETPERSRNGIGCFVGKVQEGTVMIYGTAALSANTDLTDYSTVSIGGFSFEKNLEYYTSAGGLVGFAGNGCRIYDMKVMPVSGKNITIGSDKTRFAGGMVGGMQSKASGGKTGVAIFKNCTVQEINVNGNYSGGFYGGKWNSDWTTYSITLDNCKLLGSAAAHNTIYANGSYSTSSEAGYAGGLIGRLYPFTNKDNNKVTHNVLIKDCIVSNYDITAANVGNKLSCVGGFIGYASSANDSVTCYAHDSSVEHCTIGAAGNYAGGFIGKIEQKAANQILGYNIKLDTIDTNSGEKMGAWIGYAPSDTSNQTTSIQFSGLAVYGNGFTKNIGNNATLGKVSFVYADYTGKSYGEPSTVDSITGTENFILDDTSKTITRTVKDADGKMLVSKYSYADEPEPTDTEHADGWEISGNSITHIQNNKQSVYAVTLSSSEIYAIDTENKKITRKVVSGNTAQKLEYNYTANPITESAAGAPEMWSIDETNGKISHVHDGQKDVYTIAVSGLNQGSIVDMPKYPFVNINPQSKLGESEILSGDGAVLNDSQVKATHTEKVDGVDVVRPLFHYTDTTSGSTIYYPSAQTMAAQIYADIEAKSSDRRYTTFEDEVVYDGKKLFQYMQRTTDDDGDRISTFKTEIGSDLQNNVKDFAVVVIANTRNDETTNLINRYIQLVTNTASDKNYAAEDPDHYYEVNIKTCTYKDGSFEIDPEQEDSTAGLKIEDEQFKLNSGYVDSQNTFTLVDVQFKDPFNTDSIAYHLYVPVYTIKEMTVKFYTVAKNGSHSVSYENGNDSTTYSSLIDSAKESGKFFHADSLDTWMTHFVRYEYDADDINALLRQGKLRWNYHKSITFKTGVSADDDKPLPDGTYMVLVDPNGNSDQVYYALASDLEYTVPDIQIDAQQRKSWIVDLEKFKDSDNRAFSAASFNDIIADRITPVQNADGRYSLGAENDYDVYCIVNGEKTFYKFNTDGEVKFDLSFDTSKPVYEDYYISVKVPKSIVGDTNKNDLYHYNVEIESRLSADDIRYSTAEAPKIRSAGVESPFECAILIADLFKQTTQTTVTMESGEEKDVSLLSMTPEIEQITAVSHTLTANVSVIVEPSSDSGIFYLGEDSDLYHSFYFTLVRYDKNGIDTEIIGLSKNKVTASYQIDSSESVQCELDAVELADEKPNYLNIATYTDPDTEPENGEDESSGETTASGYKNILVEKLIKNRQFEIHAVVEMPFNEESLVDEFPERSPGTQYGVNVMASSNLAYDRETLAFTSMSEKYQIADSHYYHIESTPTATLRYSSKNDDTDVNEEIGRNSKNQSTLGVNGKYAELSAMPVNTEAFYNVQTIAEDEEMKAAKWLKLTFSLNKKIDSISDGGTIHYEPIPAMQNYLSGNIKIKSGDAVPVVVSGNDAVLDGNGVPIPAVITATGDSVTAVLDVSKCKNVGDIFDIELTFDAKTGNSFHEYGNYRVDLKAELYSDLTSADGNIEISRATSYLIYTNAKVIAEMVTLTPEQEENP